MKIELNDFGCVNGCEIRMLTAKNKNGMSASFINYGATLTSLKMPDKSGNIKELTLGYHDLDSYIKDTNYFGCIVGRFANRIEKGRFCLDGKKFQLACNENDICHLHGGLNGFNKKVWDLEIIDNPTSVCANLSYKSKDGEEGYPGNLDVRVQYTFDDANFLIMDYQSTTDSSTPINLTNHAYWNLNGAGKRDILDHLLKINSDAYLEVNDKLIPTGKFLNTKNTPFDFTSMQAIGSRIKEAGAMGYDHCYVLNTKGNISIPAAKICDPESGRTMEIYTTKPGIQFYTGNFLDDKHSGFCLETQYYPNCINMPEFQYMILKPGQTYRQRTIHQFSISGK